jgi:5-methylcytosine-specific restriction endonuclease McrA
MIDAPVVPDQDCSRHMTLEHVVPLNLGGTHDLINLALACFGCNNARGSSLDWQPVE